MKPKNCGGNTHLTSKLKSKARQETETVGRLLDQDAVRMFGMDLSTGESLAEIAGMLPERRSK